MSLRYLLPALALPWPPSVNRMWRNVGNKTLLSAEGRAYRVECVGRVLEQRVPRLGLKGRLHVEIHAFPPDRRRRDVDNLLKAPLDVLKHCGIIEDDSCIDKLEITRGPCGGKGELWITIKNWEPSVEAAA